MEKTRVENFSPRDSILPTYLRSYGAQPSEQDSLSQYNQPRTCARRILFFFSFLVFFFFLSLFLFFSFFVLERGTRNIHCDIRCLLQEKQWEHRFCAKDDVERGERASSIRRQPSEKQNKRFRNHSLCDGARAFSYETWGGLERSPRIRLFDRELQGTGTTPERNTERFNTGKRGWKKETLGGNEFFPPVSGKKYHSRGLYEWKQRFAALIGFRIGSVCKLRIFLFVGSSDFDDAARMEHGREVVET